MIYILKEALRGLSQRKRMVFLSTTTMSLSLLIFGIFLITTININHGVRRLQEKVEIEIFLEDSISPGQSQRLTALLQKLDAVQETIYVSKETALREAQIDTTLIGSLGTNPLPASIRVRLKEDHRTAADIENIIRRIENETGIEEISSGRQWARQLDRYRLILFLTTVGIGILFGLASILVISNTIQLTIFSRREAITIMQLVGAADGLIRGPFVLEGFIQGILAGTIADVAITGLYWSFQQHMAWLLPIGPLPLLGFILAGGVLGGLGSRHAVERTLTQYTLF